MAERRFFDRMKKVFESLNYNAYTFLLQIENLLSTDKRSTPIGINWHNPDFELKLIKNDPSRLMVFKKQTPELCMAAVKENPFTIEYVKEQTPDLCMAAIEADTCSLHLVKDQTPEICIAALKKDENAHIYIRDFHDYAPVLFENRRNLFDMSTEEVIELIRDRRLNKDINTTIPGQVAWPTHNINTKNFLNRPSVLNSHHTHSNFKSAHIASGACCLDDLIGAAKSIQNSSENKSKAPVRQDDLER